MFYYYYYYYYWICTITTYVTGRRWDVRICIFTFIFIFCWRCDFLREDERTAAGWATLPADKKAVKLKKRK